MHVTNKTLACPTEHYRSTNDSWGGGGVGGGGGGGAGCLSDSTRRRVLSRFVVCVCVLWFVIHSIACFGLCGCGISISRVLLGSVCLDLIACFICEILGCSHLVGVFF